MWHSFISTPKNRLKVAIFSAAALSLFWISNSAFAAGNKQEIDWLVMAMQLFGGLAIFLFGMEQMAESLKAVAGERMKGILAKLTSNRFMGAVTGAFVTAIIQSSSVTTVLVVGFISAGLMSLAQSVGVIMGANIGTTITAQIVAFKVTKAALLMIGVGFFMLFSAKNEKIKQYGTMLMGLGMVFFGMSVMSEAMKPLRTFQPFLDLMVHMENPIYGILIAAAFTGLVQSSSATTGIVIVMASQGLITLPAGIALAFGANVGTCVTAMLAAIGKPREALRAALVHVIFNIAGVLVWVGIIQYLADAVITLSPSYPELTGTERLAAETPRQIANAHTIFNIANTLIFIGFTTQLARLVELLVPDLPLEEEGIMIRTKYLDDELIATPSLALDRVRMEILHMGEQVEYMIKNIMPAIRSGDKKMLAEVQSRDDNVDILHGHIVDYLGKLSKVNLTQSQTNEFLRLMEAVNDLENIGDIIETNMVMAGEELAKKQLSMSKNTQKVLSNFHAAVSKSVSSAVHAVSQKNVEAALMVTEMKSDVTEIVDTSSMHLAERLIAQEPNRVLIYTVEVQLLENMKRIYYFSKRMAKTVLPEEA